MIAYDEALRIVQSRALRLPDERLPLAQAVRRVLAEDVVSHVSLPRFASSSMDGFAVSGAHTRYRVIDRVSAGQQSAATLHDGEAIEIMTGAPLPAGAASVVKVEDVTRAGDNIEDNVIEVTRTPVAGANFRPAGEDYAPGDCVLAMGSVLTPQALMAAAAVGLNALQVYRRPRIAVIPTGNELVPPGEPLTHPASIWNSSTVYLQTALWPAEVTVHPILRDDPALFSALVDSLDADVIISTGAVSMGVQDFVAGVLGERVLFHRVAIKPGKPILFADLGARVFFGLPGNPVSTAVGARFFVWPYLARMLGLPDEAGEALPLLHAVKRPQALQCFFKARRHAGAVEVLPGQGSHLIRPLLEANCWAVLSDAGVRVFPLERQG